MAANNLSETTAVYDQVMLGLASAGRASGTLEEQAAVFHLLASDDAKRAVAEICRVATALGRHAEADEQAALFHCLAADESRYITGQALIVDGGCSLGHTPLMEQQIWGAHLMALDYATARRLADACLARVLKRYTSPLEQQSHAASRCATVYLLASG